MRQKYKCKSCEGEYYDPQDDGTRYFHECSPNKVEKGAVVDITTGVEITPAVLTPIANPRNENLTALSGTQPPTLKAEGLGTELLKE